LKRTFWLLFFASTAAGVALPFLPAGSFRWWDSAWAIVFFVAVYADLAGAAGLSRARYCSGIVVVAMAVLLGLSGLTGWPCGPLLFTPQAGLRLGGAVPLILPLLAFALLTVSGQAAAAAFPGAGRTGLAAATAAGFLLTVVNGLSLFETVRIWWVWNPLNAPHAVASAAFSLGFLGATAFALAFVYPADSRLRLSRWSTGLVAWLSVNGLFLVANFAMFLR
jgi:uncharacterized membrane protein